MNAKPLVSICIPTYERPDLLAKALDSCFAQTYKNYEIIITDDSESDSTLKFVQNLNNNTIRYIKNIKRAGLYQNVGKVVSLARGKYIKVLLDDDLLKPNCLEEMVAILEKYKSVGIVISPLEIIDLQGKIIQPNFYFIKKKKYLYKYLDRSALVDKKTILRDFLTHIYPSAVPTGFMIRKQCIEELGGFDNNFGYIIDIELCMRIATKYDFYYIDTFLSSWRYSSTASTISIIHKKGLELKLFYTLARTYLENPTVRKMFTEAEWPVVVRKSYFFATKRTCLNILSAIYQRDIKLFFPIFKTILQEDPYLFNKIKLPFSLLKEIIEALLHL